MSIRAPAPVRTVRVAPPVVASLLNCSPRTWVGTVVVVAAENAATLAVADGVDTNELDVEVVDPPPGDVVLVDASVVDETGTLVVACPGATMVVEVVDGTSVEVVVGGLVVDVGLTVEVVVGGLVVDVVVGGAWTVKHAPALRFSLPPAWVPPVSLA